MTRRREEPGTGCVLERASKQHGSIFQLRWRVNGGPARCETIGPDRREAERALAVKLDAINHGTYRERREATFHEFASYWFADHRHACASRPPRTTRSRSNATCCRSSARTCCRRSGPS